MKPSRRTIFSALLIGVLLISVGSAITAFALGSNSSQTYFVETTLGGTSASSGGQGGDLYFANVPPTNSILVSPKFSTGYNPYFLSSTTIPADVTTTDISVVLYIYPYSGSFTHAADLILEVLDYQTQATLSSGSGTSASVSGTDCASSTRVTLDITGSATTYKAGDTLELFIINADAGPLDFFYVCTGAANASYLTLNPSSSTTTTVTSATTSLSTTTETDTVISTSTLPVTTTETDTVTSMTTSVSTTTETDTVTSVSTSVSTSTVIDTQTSTVTSTVTQTSTVPSIAVSCFPSSLPLGHSTKCTATTIIGPNPGTISFAVSPAGSGTISSPPSCSMPYPNILSCKVTYTPSSGGTKTITATYSGDSRFPSASASTQITVSGGSSSSSLLAPLSSIGTSVESAPVGSAVMIAGLLFIGSTVFCISPASGYNLCPTHLAQSLFVISIAPLPRLPVCHWA